MAENKRDNEGANLGNWKENIKHPLKGIDKWIEDIVWGLEQEVKSEKKRFRYVLIPKKLEPRFYGSGLLFIISLVHLVFFRTFQWSMSAIALFGYVLLQLLVWYLRERAIKKGLEQDDIYFFFRQLFDLIIVALLEIIMPPSHSNLYFLVLLPLFSTLKRHKNPFKSALGVILVFLVALVFFRTTITDVIISSFKAEAISRLCFRGIIFFAFSIFAISTIRWYSRLRYYYKALMDSIADGVIAVRGRDPEIIEFNRTSQEMLGYTEEEAKKVGIFEMYGAPAFGKDAGEKVAKEIMNLMRKGNGKITNYETNLWTKDRKIIPISLSAATITRLDKEYGSIGVYKDRRKVMLLQDIAARSHSHSEGKNLYEDVMRRISDIITCEFVVICLFDDRKNSLTASYCHPFKLIKFLQGGNFSLDKGMPIGKSFFDSKILKLSENRGDNKYLKSDKIVKVLSKHSDHNTIESLLAVPIKVEQEAIGVLCMLNKRKTESELDTDGFSSGDEKITESLVPQLARIINDNKYRKAKEELICTSEALVNESWREEILKQFTAALQDSMKYWACYIRLLEGEDLVIKAFWGPSDPMKFVNNHKYNLKKNSTSISSRVFMNGTSEQYKNVKEIKEFGLKSLINSEKLKSMLSMPMIHKGEVIGVLNCYTARQHFFSHEEREVVQSYTEFMTSAIMRSEVIEKLDIFVKMSSMVYQTDSLDRAVYTILTSIASEKGLGFHRVAIFLNNEQNNIEMEGKWGIDCIFGRRNTDKVRRQKKEELDLEKLCTDRDRFENWKFSDTFNKQIETATLHTRTKCMKEMMNQDKYFLKFSAEQYPLKDLWKEIAHPKEYALVWISIAGRRRGIIYLDNVYNGHITESKLPTVYLFGSLLAGNRERFRVDEALNLAIRTAMHQIKGPLATVTQNVKPLIKKAPFQDKNMQTLLRNIEIASRKASLTSQKILSLAKIDIGAIQPTIESIEIRDFINLVLNEFSEENRSRITLEIQSGLFYSDTVLASQCLLFILDNAITHTTGEVTVRTKISGSTVKISVIDNGPGIPKHKRRLIFRRYYTDHAKSGKKGAGIGLYLLDRLSRLISAKCEIEDSEDPGVTFSITFEKPRRDS